MPRVIVAAVPLVFLALVPVAPAQAPRSCGCGWSGYMPTMWTQGIPPGFTPTGWGQGLPWGYTPTSWMPGHWAMPPCGHEMAEPAGVVPDTAPAPTAPAPAAKEVLPPPRPADPEKK
jgi:hypothetical protein